MKNQNSQNWKTEVMQTPAPERPKATTRDEILVNLFALGGFALSMTFIIALVVGSHGFIRVSTMLYWTIIPVLLFASMCYWMTRPEKPTK